jgi:hypothetical protein
MSTLAQMRSRIADDINRNDINTQIDKAINRAIRFYYNSERFWFNETVTTFSTIANQNDYGSSDGIPSTLLEIDYLKLINSGKEFELDERTYQYIQSINGGNYAGQPTDYAYYQGKIYLYPTPNQIWTISLSYRKSYAELSSDSDTNDFTTYAEDLIEARASWWVYKRILKDYEAAKDSKNEELEALTALSNATYALTATGQITPTDF